MNVKVLYLVEPGTCTIEIRVRPLEKTLFIFDKVIFLKFTTKAVTVIQGMHQHPPGCEATFSDISPGVCTTNLHWLDKWYHILLLYIHNFIVAKLDYHTSEEPVDLFLTTPVVCTRQQ